MGIPANLSCQNEFRIKQARRKHQLERATEVVIIGEKACRFLTIGKTFPEKNN